MYRATEQTFLTYWRLVRNRRLGSHLCQLLPGTLVRTAGRNAGQVAGELGLADGLLRTFFFSTVKGELEGIDEFECRAGATRSIGDYIDGVYNIQRARVPPRLSRALRFHSAGPGPTPRARQLAPRAAGERGH
jgi:hypothetical protein